MPSFGTWRAPERAIPSSSLDRRRFLRRSTTYQNRSRASSTAWPSARSVSRPPRKPSGTSGHRWSPFGARGRSGRRLVPGDGGSCFLHHVCHARHRAVSFAARSHRGALALWLARTSWRESRIRGTRTPRSHMQQTQYMFWIATACGHTSPLSRMACDNAAIRRSRRGSSAPHHERTTRASYADGSWSAGTGHAR